MGWVATSWAALAFLSPAIANAAEVAWSAPAECQRAELVEQQVEKLVGRRLSSIDWISFEVEVSVGDDGAHRVVLRTLAQGSAPREREIAGASCAEVTDAVSVAIALTISEKSREREAAEAEPATTELPRAPAEPAGPVEPNEPNEPTEPAGPRFAVGLGLLIEAGALPDPVPGLDLNAALALGSVRIGGFVAVFLPQDTLLPDDKRGGRFDLVLAGLDLCAQPSFDALRLLACAGFELGRIGARGDGVLNKRSGDAGWYAPRVELGAGYAFAPIARLWLRAGVAVPLSRPEFVLDEDDRVHQPGTSLRGLLGLEIVL